MSIRSFITLSVVAAMVAGCGASVEYNSDYDPTADFSNIRTYQWAERTPTGDDDPRGSGGLRGSSPGVSRTPRACRSSWLIACVMRISCGISS